MQCPRCGAFNAYKAQKCYNCSSVIDITMPTNKFMPDGDMYGHQVEELVVDEYKNIARNRHISKLPEFIGVRNIKPKGGAKEVVLEVSKLVVFIFFYLYMASRFCFDKRIPIAIILIGIIVSCIYIYSKRDLFKRDKIDSNDSLYYSKQMDVLHKRKKVYYYSHNVIGYTVFVKKVVIEDKVTDYYLYYEVDRKNIIDIVYDSYFGEYVFRLRKPIYMDYNLPMVREFRLPDIFDDTALSVALDMDLPPRNTPF